VRVHHPEFHAIARAMKAHEVGAQRRTAIESSLADALRELRDEEVVAVELLRRERQVTWSRL
jgi:hypothetical protein